MFVDGTKNRKLNERENSHMSHFGQYTDTLTIKPTFQNWTKTVYSLLTHVTHHATNNNSLAVQFLQWPVVDQIDVETKFSQHMSRLLLGLTNVLTT